MTYNKILFHSGIFIMHFVALLADYARQTEMHSEDTESPGQGSESALEPLAGVG